MASISRGRPASPASIPNAGIQTPPIVVRCRIRGVDSEAGQPTFQAKRRPMPHTAILRAGADRPRRLARARHPELLGACAYFTQPQIQTTSAMRPKIGTTAQKSTNQMLLLWDVAGPDYVRGGRLAKNRHYTHRLDFGEQTAQACANACSIRGDVKNILLPPPEARVYGSRHPVPCQIGVTLESCVLPCGFGFCFAPSQQLHVH